MSAHNTPAETVAEMVAALRMAEARLLEIAHFTSYSSFAAIAAIRAALAKAEAP